MKIRSITLEGFWGYRESVTVCIDGLPLLVAVGHNGSGKSALVVSGVLAGLYGKFPTRTVEESITTGAASGTVIVEFEVSGCIYRVSRTYPRSGAATAAVLCRVDGEWEAVTEKGVREATAKVTELLGMGYETAVMTWVAEQGQYGMFANAQPAARFKMLATVFDLAKYTPLHRAAQERLRAARDQAQVAEGRVTELNDDLISDDADAEDTTTDAALAEEAASAHASAEEATAALAAHQQDDPRRAVEAAQLALDAVRSVRVERLRTAETALTELRAARDREPARHAEAVTAAHARFTSAVEAESARIAAHRQDAQQRTTAAQDELAQLTVLAERTTDLLAVLTTARDTADAAAAAQAQEEASRAAHTRELEDTERALWLAQTATKDAQTALAALAHAGDCYACGQHITEQVATSLRTAQEHVIAGCVAQEQSAADTRDNAAAALASTAARVLQLTATTRTWEQAVEQARAHAEAASAAATRVPAARDALQRAVAAEQRLGEDDSAMQARLTATRDEDIAAADTELEAQLAAITTRGKAAAAQVNATRTPTPDEEQLSAALTDAERRANDNTHHQDETARLTAARDMARARASMLDAELGRRAEIARRQAQQGQRIAAAKAELAGAREQERVHTELVAAYAPSGIPSMVLESVIEDLNTTINVTLAELSGGDLAVRLTTARETSGGSAESKVTVYVDTPTGTRSYEALSGGQRFRVDLAIRTGLAAIIARGTGTPIETFILDEGWGSLDEAGVRSTLGVLGRLAEQTNVLTVSHIDSVRDAFPARIEVTTNEGTAHATVVR